MWWHIVFRLSHILFVTILPRQLIPNSLKPGTAFKAFYFQENLKLCFVLVNLPFTEDF